MTEPHGRSDRPSGDVTPAVAAAQFSAARQPPERAAAVMLAAAQRDLARCRASGPAALAGRPGVTDPQAEYDAWLARMTEYERWAREQARRLLAINEEWDRIDDRRSGPLADVLAFSIRRARTAVQLMLGDDEAAARAAREDVLTAWYVDDDLAREAAGLRPRGRARSD